VRKRGNYRTGIRFLNVQVRKPSSEKESTTSSCAVIVIVNPSAAQKKILIVERTQKQNVGARGIYVDGYVRL
jgi:hypothetical protein